MARLVVRDPEQGTETPFLRGILTRSLQDSGLTFEEAYALASKVRQQLLNGHAESDPGGTVSVSSRGLQASVIRALRKNHRDAALRRYRARRQAHESVQVRTRDGRTVVFSQAYHQRALQSCGLTADEASALVRLVYQELRDRQQQPVDARDIDLATHKLLDRVHGEAVAHRYLVWRDFVQSGRPLILMLGGTAGCGKSTIATEIASRLDIVRTQSTDMLREVMRVMLPPRLLPVLHASSFDAWEELPQASHHTGDDEAMIAAGYQAQADLLSVACEAVVQRATRERVSMILEGVHVHPGLMARVATEQDVLVVPVMLAVLDAPALRNRLQGRGSKAPGRRSKRYLRAFDAIWSLQSHLLSEADRAGIPIIQNIDEGRVFIAIMRVILDRLSEGFERTVEDVFVPAADREANVP